MAEDETVGSYGPMDLSLNKLWEIVKGREACMLQSMGSQRIRHNLATEQQQVIIGDFGTGEDYSETYGSRKLVLCCCITWMEKGERMVRV